MKRLRTFAGLKKGTKFKVLDTSGGNNYPLNKILTMNKDGTGWQQHDIAKEFHGNTVNAGSCVLVKQSKEDLIEELVSLKKDYEKTSSEIADKIEFLENNDEKEFDEDIFKVYRILKSLKTNNNDINKAKLIAKIIS